MGSSCSSFDHLDGVLEKTPDALQTVDLPVWGDRYCKYLKWEHVPSEVKTRIKLHILKYIPKPTEALNLKNITTLTIPGFHWFLRKNIVGKPDVCLLSKEPILEILKEVNVPRPFTIHTDQRNWIVSFVVNPEIKSLQEPQTLAIETSV